MNEVYVYICGEVTQVKTKHPRGIRRTVRKKNQDLCNLILWKLKQMKMISNVLHDNTFLITKFVTRSDYLEMISGTISCVHIEKTIIL